MSSTLAATLDAERILSLPTYSWAVAEVGDEAPVFSYVVTAEGIARYCDAVRNWNPLYLDESAARKGPFGRIVAPPCFAIMAAPLRRNEAMHAKGYAAPEEKGEYQTPYARCELRFRRSLHLGDTVTSRVFLGQKEERRGRRFAHWCVEATNQDGEPLFDYTYVVIWPDGPGVARKAETSAEPDPLPDIDPADALPLVTKLETQDAIDRYSHNTKVRPKVGTNLHIDPEFASRTLFGGTANSGPASLAYCTEVLEQGYGPAALLRPGARVEFKGIRPVRAGDEIMLRGKVALRESDRHQIEIWMHGQDGRLRGVGSGTVIVPS
jgi:acyl dehydratase